MNVFRGTAAAVMIVSAVAFGAAPAALAQGMPGRADERISAEQLKKLHDAGSVIVVDVRPVTAYRDSHIAGAVSAPLDALPHQAAALKASGKVIATYCT